MRSGIRSPRRRRATDAGPASDSIGCPPGGGASAAPPDAWGGFQPMGGEAGCSQAKRPGRRWLDWLPPARATISATAATVTVIAPIVTRARVVILDTAVAVVRPAVVVGVAIAAVVLRDAAGCRRRRGSLRSRRWRRRRRRCLRSRRLGRRVRSGLSDLRRVSGSGLRWRARRGRAAAAAATAGDDQRDDRYRCRTGDELDGSSANHGAPFGCLYLVCVRPAGATVGAGAAP